MAQLQASGHPDKTTRLAPLLDLTRRLYGYGYKREQIGPLLRWVESMVRLPPELETEYLLVAKALEIWALNILDATTLEDVFRD
ncbi:MAG: hypothetical protein WBA82_00550 [Castellaniella sp.]|uniref:hypothetical protein n=1 Tax=Castellaniella sp. TaxID=1955812 RepID=UPI003C73E304